MIGTVIGDVVGSVYEFDNICRKDFPLLSENCEATDDSIAWWKAHPDQIVRKKVYAHTCLNCRDVFHSHRANSQYCSRKCFSESRRSEVRK